MAKVPPKPSGKGVPPQAINAIGNLDRPEPQDFHCLNFKVSAAFKAEFKSYAALQGKSMNTVLQEAFKLYKAANSVVLKSTSGPKAD